MQSRKIEPDFVKGIAIILMVYGHMTHVGAWALQQINIVEIIYSFHMPLFLMISGFFLNMKKPCSVLLSNLFSKIARPYFIFITLYLLGLMMISHFGIKTSNIPPSSWLQIVKLELYKPIGAYWFLHSLIVITISFIAGKFISQLLKFKHHLLITILFLAIFNLIGMIQFRTITYFIIGVLFAHLYKELPRSYIMSSVVLLILLFGFKIPLMFSWQQIIWCVSILTLITAIANKFHELIITSFIAYIGRNSLIILLLHSLVIIALKPISFLFLRLDVTGVLYSIFTVLFTISVCFMFAFFSDKLRLSLLLFGSDKVYSKFIIF